VTIETWLEMAIADARRRGLEALEPLLQGLAQSTRQLRAADWNDDASGGAGQRPAGTGGGPGPHDPR
jgi:hypothetical protein